MNNTPYSHDAQANRIMIMNAQHLAKNFALEVKYESIIPSNLYIVPHQ